jgi:salicylate hydroxylase
MADALLISGAGIAGLAAALALSRAGAQVSVVERAPHLSTEGAGVQLGPNVTRILRAWGFQDALNAVAVFPQHLCARDARDGRVVGQVALSAGAQRYGAPHVCIHRADLQTLLWQAVQQESGLQWHWGQALQSVNQTPDHVTVRSDAGQTWQAEGLVVAEGIGSPLRRQVLGDGAATPTGHVALRALLPMADVPVAWRSSDVQVWMGVDFHLVHYPVRGGQWLNLVLVLNRPDMALDAGWSSMGDAAWAQRAVDRSCTDLRDLVGAVSEWRYWVLADRQPLASASEMAVGRVAVIGDAAHPMRPYLAQGAGMAIEDAAAMQAALQGPVSASVAAAWQTMAHSRWQRVAQVQQQSRRNGRIFHSTGLVRWGRNLALQAWGSHLMDPEWLYGGGPMPMV